MTTDLRCSSCSGALHPTGKSQRVRCEFCGADNLLDGATYARLAAAPPVAPPVALEAIIGKLQGHGDDLPAFLEGLANRLGAALPDSVEVEKRGGLFSKAHVAKVQARLADYQYTVELDGKHLKARRVHTVRGIALKSQELTLAELIDALAAELYELAQQGEAAKGALHRFLNH